MPSLSHTKKLVNCHLCNPIEHLTEMRLFSEINPPLKPIISDDFNRRCQVDLIDLQSQPDGEFRFVMVYQDHLRHIHVP